MRRSGVCRLYKELTNSPGVLLLFLFSVRDESECVYIKRKEIKHVFSHRIECGVYRHADADGLYCTSPGVISPAQA